MTDLQISGQESPFFQDGDAERESLVRICLRTHIFEALQAKLWHGWQSVERFPSACLCMWPARHCGVCAGLCVLLAVCLFDCVFAEKMTTTSFHLNAVSAHATRNSETRLSARYPPLCTPTDHTLLCDRHTFKASTAIAAAIARPYSPLYVAQRCHRPLIDPAKRTSLCSHDCWSCISPSDMTSTSMCCASGSRWCVPNRCLLL